jgi:hypothetical protein
MEIARGFVSMIGEHFPEMIEEMDGIASGASLKLDEIVLINARTDILADVEGGITLQNAPCCAALALCGELDAKPAIALGQNWNWNPLIARSPVVLRLVPDGSIATLAGVIMDLTRNRFILTEGPPHENPWIERPGVSNVPQRLKSSCRAHNRRNNRSGNLEPISFVNSQRHWVLPLEKFPRKPFLIHCYFLSINL